jgi:hypothetical protein
MGTEDEVIDELSDLLARGAKSEAIVALAGEVIALGREIARLKGRLGQIESKVIPDYQGHWEDDRFYKIGQAATLGGSLWIAVADTAQRPSTHSKEWCLAVRSGRDGKSAKPRDDAWIVHERERARAAA